LVARKVNNLENYRKAAKLAKVLIYFSFVLFMASRLNFLSEGLSEALLFFIALR